MLYANYKPFFHQDQATTLTCCFKTVILSIDYHKKNQNQKIAGDLTKKSLSLLNILIVAVSRLVSFSVGRPTNLIVNCV